MLLRDTEWLTSIIQQNDDLVRQSKSDMFYGSTVGHCKESWWALKLFLMGKYSILSNITGSFLLQG